MSKFNSMSFSNLRVRCLVLLLVAINFACQSDDESVPNPLQVETWIGEYEIDTIGINPVGCSIEFQEGELFALNRDETFTITSTCTDNLIADGSYTFEKGVFQLFVSFRVTEPDRPEFELQIFDSQDGRITMYRCLPNFGECTIRRGRRL